MKNKKTLLIFIVGLLSGALLMGGGMWMWNHARSERLAEPAVAEGAEENLEDAPASAENGEGASQTDTEEIVAADSAEGTWNAEDVQNAEGTWNAEAVQNAEDTWNAETVYTGGDEVAYNGKIYRAKWWTQGEEPGKADVWEDTLVAAGQSVVQPESIEDGAEDSQAETDESDSEDSRAQTEEVKTGQKSSDDEVIVGKRDDFKVVGYFPSWKENTDSIQYDVITHVNYAFAIPTPEGGLLPLENAQIAEKIIKEAHKNNVKVFLAVGGWSYHDVPLESAFVAATETEAKREALADAIVAMCDQYGFDGVDLDWEHPRVDGDSSKQYEELITALAERLHKQDKQLSSAVLSGVTADGNVYYDAAAHTDKVLETVDWINVMAYDGGDGERHSSYDFAVNCGNYWKEMRRIPSEKVVLGVPFYARPSWAAYGDILSQVPDAWSRDNTDYNGMDVWYNGAATIEKKTAYALKNLGGVMIWEISQDASGSQSLQSVIGKTVKESKEI